MKPRCLLRLAFVCALLTPFLSSNAAQPNIVIFYADDLGWGELGCQGYTKDIPTPHIDALAKNGLRFTNGYVAATYCSPSRAGLMTGRYPTRFGHEFNTVANTVGLRADQTTIATRLKTLGYATIAVGKWHLGNQPENLPTKRGFDEFYGTLNNTPFFHPTNFIDSRISNEVQTVTDPNFYTTDAYADRSIDWIEKNKTKPWFLYLPFNAQHAPLQAPKKYLERFPKITDEKRQLFAAMMASMDDAIGRVVGKIRALGQEENTLIFFIADNGGPTASTTSHNGPLRGFKMTTFEGGPRVPYIAQWKGKIPAGKTYDLPVMNLDVLPTAIIAAGGKTDSSWQLDGVDLMPYLTGKLTSRPHQTLYWRYGPQWAIRHGDLKLVVSKGGSGQPELYDLATDIGESKDLASDQPAKVKELQALWDKWSAEQAPASTPDASGGGATKKNKKKKGK
jgi:arylsulfatase A-like enzyme